VFEDGTVAALEELIGNHGGLGGEQTDAFLFIHPGGGGPRAPPATYSPSSIVAGSERSRLRPRPQVIFRVREWSPDNLMAA